MTTVRRGAPNTLTVEWRSYAGGPYVSVSGVTIEITSMADSSTALAATSTGVTNPATGINAYSWTPSGSLDLGDYLISWSGTDPDGDTVEASEIVTLASTTATGAAYATRAELKRRQGIPDTNTYLDSDLDDALLAASRQVDRYCGRSFGRTEVADASARTFRVGRSGVQTDDFWTTDGLIVNGIAWADFTNLELEPSDGVLDGLTGWPYFRITPTWCGLWAWPWGASLGLSSRIEVTAAWGWEAVPDEVKSATLMLAAEELKLKDTPFGVAGFGDYVVRVRSNPKVAERLDPFRVRVGMVA